MDENDKFRIDLLLKYEKILNNESNSDIEPWTCKICGWTGATRMFAVIEHCLAHIRKNELEPGVPKYKITLARIDAKPGQCYMNAALSMIANSMFAESHRMYYVQGIVTSSTDGKRIGHCWVELTDPDTGKEYVFEPVQHGLIPKEDYYTRGAASNIHRYDFAEMALKLLETDLYGAWTEDVASAWHTDDMKIPPADRELVQRARALGAPAIDFD